MHRKDLVSLGVGGKQGSSSTSEDRIKPEKSTSVSRKPTGNKGNVKVVPTSLAGNCHPSVQATVHSNATNPKLTSTTCASTKTRDPNLPQQVTHNATPAQDRIENGFINFSENSSALEQSVSPVPSFKRRCHRRGGSVTAWDRPQLHHKRAVLTGRSNGTPVRRGGTNSSVNPLVNLRFWGQSAQVAASRGLKSLASSSPCRENIPSGQSSHTGTSLICGLELLKTDLYNTEIVHRYKRMFTTHRRFTSVSDHVMDIKTAFQGEETLQKLKRQIGFFTGVIQFAELLLLQHAGGHNDFWLDDKFKEKSMAAIRDWKREKETEAKLIKAKNGQDKKAPARQGPVNPSETIESATDSSSCSRATTSARHAHHSAKRAMDSPTRCQDECTKKFRRSQSRSSRASPHYDSHHARREARDESRSRSRESTRSRSRSRDRDEREKKGRHSADRRQKSCDTMTDYRRRREGSNVSPEDMKRRESNNSERDSRQQVTSTSRNHESREGSKSKSERKALSNDSAFVSESQKGTNHHCKSDKNGIDNKKGKIAKGDNSKKDKTVESSSVPCKRKITDCEEGAPIKNVNPVVKCEQEITQTNSEVETETRTSVGLPSLPDVEDKREKIDKGSELSSSNCSLSSQRDSGMDVDLDLFLYDSVTSDCCEGCPRNEPKLSSTGQVKLQGNLDNSKSSASPQEVSTSNSGCCRAIDTTGSGVHGEADLSVLQAELSSAKLARCGTDSKEFHSTAEDTALLEEKRPETAINGTDISSIPAQNKICNLAMPQHGSGTQDQLPNVNLMEEKSQPCDPLARETPKNRCVGWVQGGSTLNEVQLAEKGNGDILSEEVISTLNNVECIDENFVELVDSGEIAFCRSVKESANNEGSMATIGCSATGDLSSFGVILHNQLTTGGSQMLDGSKGIQNNARTKFSSAVDPHRLGPLQDVDTTEVTSIRVSGADGFFSSVIGDCVTDETLVLPVVCKEEIVSDVACMVPDVTCLVSDVVYTEILRSDGSCRVSESGEGKVTISQILDEHSYFSRSEPPRLDTDRKPNKNLMGKWETTEVLSGSSTSFWRSQNLADQTESSNTSLQTGQFPKTRPIVVSAEINSLACPLQSNGERQIGVSNNASEKETIPISKTSLDTDVQISRKEECNSHSGLHNAKSSAKPFKSDTDNITSELDFRGVEIDQEIAEVLPASSSLHLSAGWVATTLLKGTGGKRLKGMCCPGFSTQANASHNCSLNRKESGDRSRDDYFEKGCKLDNSFHQKLSRSEHGTCVRYTDPVPKSLNRCLPSVRSLPRLRYEAKTRAYPHLSYPNVVSRLTKAQILDMISDLCRVVRPLSPLPDDDEDVGRVILRHDAAAHFQRVSNATSGMCWSHEANTSRQFAAAFRSCSMSVSSEGSVQFRLQRACVQQLLRATSGLRVTGEPEVRMLPEGEINVTSGRDASVKTADGLESTFVKRQEKTKSDHEKDGTASHCVDCISPATRLVCVASISQPLRLKDGCVSKELTYKDQSNEVNCERQMSGKDSKNDTDNPHTVVMALVTPSTAAQYSTNNKFEKTSLTNSFPTRNVVAPRPKSDETKDFHAGMKYEKTSQGDHDTSLGLGESKMAADRNNNYNGSECEDKQKETKPSPAQKPCESEPPAGVDFLCDMVYSPVLLHAADRVYHIHQDTHGGSRGMTNCTVVSEYTLRENNSGLTDGDTNVKTEIDGFPGLYSTLNRCEKPGRDKFRALDQVMDTAGISDVELHSLLQSDQCLETFVTNNAPIRSQSLSTAENFVDAVFSSFDITASQDPGPSSVKRENTALSPRRERDPSSCPNITLSTQPSKRKKDSRQPATYSLRSGVRPSSDQAALECKPFALPPEIPPPSNQIALEFEPYVLLSDVRPQLDQTKLDSKPYSLKPDARPSTVQAALEIKPYSLCSDVCTPFDQAALESKPPQILEGQTISSEVSFHCPNVFPTESRMSVQSRNSQITFDSTKMEMNCNQDQLDNCEDIDLTVPTGSHFARVVEEGAGPDKKSYFLLDGRSEVIRAVSDDNMSERDTPSPRPSPLLGEPLDFEDLITLGSHDWDSEFTSGTSKQAQTPTNIARFHEGMGGPPKVCGNSVGVMRRGNANSCFQEMNNQASGTMSHARSNVAGNSIDSEDPLAGAWPPHCSSKIETKVNPDLYNGHAERSSSSDSTSDSSSDGEDVELDNSDLTEAIVIPKKKKKKRCKDLSRVEPFEFPAGERRRCLARQCHLSTRDTELSCLIRRGIVKQPFRPEKEKSTIRTGNEEPDNRKARVCARSLVVVESGRGKRRKVQGHEPSLAAPQSSDSGVKSEQVAGVAQSLIKRENHPSSSRTAHSSALNCTQMLTTDVQYSNSHGSTSGGQQKCLTKSEGIAEASREGMREIITRSKRKTREEDTMPTVEEMASNVQRYVEKRREEVTKFTKQLSKLLKPGCLKMPTLADLEPRKVHKITTRIIRPLRVSKQRQARQKSATTGDKTGQTLRATQGRENCNNSADDGREVSSPDKGNEQKWALNTRQKRKSQQQGREDTGSKDRGNGCGSERQTAKTDTGKEGKARRRKGRTSEVENDANSGLKRVRTNADECGKNQRDFKKGNNSENSSRRLCDTRNDDGARGGIEVVPEDKRVSKVRSLDRQENHEPPTSLAQVQERAAQRRKLKLLQARLRQTHYRQYSAPDTGQLQVSLNRQRHHDQGRTEAPAFRSRVEPLPKLGEESERRPLGVPHNAVHKGKRKGDTETRMPEENKIVPRGGDGDRASSSLLRFVHRLNSSYGDQLNQGRSTNREKLSRLCQRFLGQDGDSGSDEVDHQASRDPSVAACNTDAGNAFGSGPRKKVAGDRGSGEPSGLRLPQVTMSRGLTESKASTSASTSKTRDEMCRKETEPRRLYRGENKSGKPDRPVSSYLKSSLSSHTAPNEVVAHSTNNASSNAMRPHPRGQCSESKGRRHSVAWADEWDESMDESTEFGRDKQRGRPGEAQTRGTAIQDMVKENPSTFKELLKRREERQKEESMDLKTWIHTRLTQGTSSYQPSRPSHQSEQRTFGRQAASTSKLKSTSEKKKERYCSLGVLAMGDEATKSSARSNTPEGGEQLSLPSILRTEAQQKLVATGMSPRLPESPDKSLDRKLGGMCRDRETRRNSPLGDHEEIGTTMSEDLIPLSDMKQISENSVPPLTFPHLLGCKNADQGEKNRDERKSTTCRASVDAARNAFGNDTPNRSLPWIKNPHKEAWSTQDANSSHKKETVNTKANAATHRSKPDSSKGKRRTVGDPGGHGVISPEDKVRAFRKEACFEQSGNVNRKSARPKDTPESDSDSEPSEHDRVASLRRNQKAGATSWKSEVGVRDEESMLYNVALPRDLCDPALFQDVTSSGLSSGEGSKTDIPTDVPQTREQMLKTCESLKNRVVEESDTKWAKHSTASHWKNELRHQMGDTGRNINCAQSLRGNQANKPSVFDHPTSQQQMQQGDWHGCLDIARGHSSEIERNGSVGYTGAVQTTLREDSRATPISPPQYDVTEDEYGDPGSTSYLPGEWSLEPLTDLKKMADQNFGNVFKSSRTSGPRQDLPSGSQGRGEIDTQDVVGGQLVPVTELMSFSENSASPLPFLPSTRRPAVRKGEQNQSGIEQKSTELYQCEERANILSDVGTQVNAKETPESEDGNDNHTAISGQETPNIQWGQIGQLISCSLAAPLPQDVVDSPCNVIGQGEACPPLAPSQRTRLSPIPECAEEEFEETELNEHEYSEVQISEKTTERNDDTETEDADPEQCREE